MAAGRRRGGEVILGFTVKGVELLFERVAAAGGKVTDPVRQMDEMGSKVGFVRDAEGHLIEIVEQLWTPQEREVQS
jgi:predicted enzyme related to lactoylglutathione lyase